MRGMVTIVMALAVLALFIAATGRGAETRPAVGGRASASTATESPRFTPHLTVPPFVEGRLVYFHAFSRPEPDVNRIAAEAAGKLQLVHGGFAGRCAALADKQPLILTSPALSPHKPLTLAYWWSLPDGLAANAGGQFFSLTGQGPGYISAFVRGGPWCGLNDSAHVLQLYRFPGVRDHNGVFDRTFRQNVALGSGQWHLTVFTVSNGSELKLYLDGRLVADHDLRGRSLTAEDGLQRLTLGPFAGPSGLHLDELMILDAALGPDQVKALHDAVRALKDIGLLDATAARALGSVPLRVAVRPARGTDPLSDCPPCCLPLLAAPHVHAGLRAGHNRTAGGRSCGAGKTLIFPHIWITAGRAIAALCARPP